MKERTICPSCKTCLKCGGHASKNADKTMLRCNDCGNRSPCWGGE